VTSDVVVVGGGLAGVACAHVLAKNDVDVTLVDRNDYNQFQPLLYQVCTSQLPAQDIARPLASIFARYPRVNVLQAQVTKANLAERTLTLEAGQTLSGEHLVLAAGAQPNFFGIEGAAEHSFPLYSVADAERLRLHGQQLLQHHDMPGALDVVIVGAGPTGVETAGAVAELGQARRAMAQLPTQGSVHIVDAGSAVLGQFSEKAQAYAREKLTNAEVELHLGRRVTRVSPEGVELDDGTLISARTVIWAGGESGAALAGDAGPTPGRGGRIDVQDDLRVEGFPGVYAVGDVANIPAAPGGESHALPQLGSVAQQSGAWAAENILRERRGEPLKPFRYKDKGIMAMIGRNAAVAEVGKHHHQVDGPLAFAAWLGVHAMLLSGVHAKTDAFMTWAWDYFDRDHSATLEIYSKPQRIGWSGEDGNEAHISAD
jgi:NADH dehydrogenase